MIIRKANYISISLLGLPNVLDRAGCIDTNDSYQQLRKRGLVRRGPKGKKYWNISTKEKNLQEKKYQARRNDFWKTEEIGSVVLDISGEANLNEFEPSSHYADYEFWSGEPAIYSCNGNGKCLGKIETKHGYLLACWSCNP